MSLTIPQQRPISQRFATYYQPIREEGLPTDMASEVSETVDMADPHHPIAGKRLDSLPGTEPLPLSHSIIADKPEEPELALPLQFKLHQCQVSSTIKTPDSA